MARSELLLRLVRERTARDSQALQAQGLTTRRDELQAAAQAAARLSAARGVLRAAGLDVALNAAALERLCARVAELRRRVGTDPDALTAAGAFDHGEFQRVLEGARATLLQAWRRYVAVGEGDGLAGVLERVAPFRAAAQKLRRVQQELTRLAANLPPDDRPVRNVRELKEQADGALRELGLDGPQLDLLTRSLADGYPLQDLLADEGLLAWLRDTGGLPSCFRIVLS
jgi:hypothetical protein